MTITSLIGIVSVCVLVGTLAGGVLEKYLEVQD